MRWGAASLGSNTTFSMMPYTPTGSLAQRVTAVDAAATATNATIKIRLVFMRFSLSLSSSVRRLTRIPSSNLLLKWQMSWAQGSQTSRVRRFEDDESPNEFRGGRGGPL